jgi:hypothetical protein
MEEESWFSLSQENRETTLYAKTQSASCTLARRQSAEFIYLPGTKSRPAAAAAAAAWNVRNGGVDFSLYFYNHIHKCSRQRRRSRLTEQELILIEEKSSHANRKVHSGV